MTGSISPGVHYGVANKDYHASQGVSKSGLDLITRSPAHYYAKYLDPNREPRGAQTIAQLNGELAHCAILEPREFASRFEIGPDVTRSTKAWKDFESSLPAGMTGIKHDQYVTAWAQAESVNRIPDINRALANGLPEVSAYWIDPETGVLCKCRPDFVHDCGDAGAILVDVKTCGDARPFEFSRMIAKHRYHVQAAYYTDGFELASGRKVLGFIFASVEMDYPHVSSAIMLDEDSLEQGRVEYRRGLDVYSGCLTTNQWPGISAEVHLARLPGWAFDKNEEIEINYV